MAEVLETAIEGSALKRAVVAVGTPAVVVDLDVAERNVAGPSACTTRRGWATGRI
jgi:hypothetical protein